MSPLSLVPLAGLVALWLVPYLWRGGRPPTLSGPLFTFAGLAVLSACAAFALPILPFKGETLIEREARAMLTLAIGLGYYACASTLIANEDAMRASLRFLYLGGAVNMMWSTVQAWPVLREADHVPLIITQVHHIFSIRDPLPDRVTGLTYEPSWLGNQLVVLYLPLLLAGVFHRRSVFTPHARVISWELALLLWGGLLLLLTQSRISQLSMLLIGLLLYGILSFRIVERRLARRRSVSGPGRASWPYRPVGGLLVLAGAVAIALSAGWVASRVDDRLHSLPSIGERLSEIRYFYPNEEPLELANRLAFAERVAYWSAGYRTFSKYPLLGVGPGNAGFFFEENLPAYALQLTEIQDVLRDESFGFPNPKNLWVRLLAENGIVGFGAFGVWMGLIALTSLALWLRGSGLERVVGMAGAFAATVQVVEGFSLDTYALPQLWIIFGLVSNAAWRGRRLSHSLPSLSPGGVGREPFLSQVSGNG